jgi:hypothetical protein
MMVSSEAVKSFKVAGDSALPVRPRQLWDKSAPGRGVSPDSGMKMP